MTPFARNHPAAHAEVAYGDTNLFVALFAGDNHPLHAAALGLFRRVAKGSLALIVTPLIVGELAYVGESVLKWSRRTIETNLSRMLEADGLVVPEAAILLRALELYGEHARLDFADAYLAACALELGPPAVASLDRDFDRIAGITRLPS